MSDTFGHFRKSSGPPPSESMTSPKDRGEMARISRASILLYAVVLISGSQYMFLTLLGTVELEKSKEVALEAPSSIGAMTTNATSVEVEKTYNGADLEYCQTKGSLNEIVYKMANHSSPPGSASHMKLKRILDNANGFYIYLMIAIFQNVSDNIANMLEGYGLQKTSSSGHDVIRVETTVRPKKCMGANCTTDAPRIVIQCEQLAAVGDKHLEYLQTCHLSSNCIIWEFSSYNYEWAKKHGIADSVVLLPTMIQSRLDAGKRNTPTIPLQNRSMDVAFFGSMYDRRKSLRQEILDKHNWTMHFGHSLKKNVMISTYRNAKVCLVAHSFNATTGGEYHRLSESATMGCVPVMEEFADAIAIDDYSRCGGVVFAKYEHLTETVERILHEIDASERYNNEIVEWWKRGIEWESILPRIFG